MSDRDESMKPAPGHDDPELDPFEIDFRPEFRSSDEPREPFVNSQGVVIGDHDYQSPNSPLEQWSRDTDPAVMAGDEWVHPFKDVGFHTKENRDYFERGIPPQGGIFMHPDKDVAYEVEAGQAEDGEDRSSDA
ncbi:DUF3905 domain-containing protein [Gordoniibacillus kamchatkensis]|uniref:DUF3905 domain-containing protein n=1 Tax=Gordoniibacillus kamchatkensis TaxID=1590651 RepID=UPI00069781D1|nr:DUF3905 domain-containing protein [Paenibacillus sp. VKM B-2647]